MLIGFFLPAERVIANLAVELNGSPAAYFDQYSSRHGQQLIWKHAWKRFQWEGYPMNIVDLGGPDSGIGTKLGYYTGGKQSGSLGAFFSSIARGNGEIVECEKNKKVVIEIKFGFVTTTRENLFEESGDNQTRITWTETVKASNPLTRWLLLVSDDSSSTAFEQVLLALDDVVNGKNS